jgi:hypothetical protein
LPGEKDGQNRSRLWLLGKKHFQGFSLTIKRFTRRPQIPSRILCPNKIFWGKKI